ncbi:cAMP-dependent protein kinase type, putative [Perkinsus marinus ATCC 50983]|uniref:cAMP-dependent protein kinase type, putative n=1 Tax=Perkinsus marinus (strain ATCC 50983 / TXsc) TaxID=423536 RepID=C5LDQ1_PERM5|nr:cAMP-dependent protein kinase type, putative [Perkinsus marinus ATCC 50983]EER05065.1 cAMP-dependent protein kinase type, putative [Perkinsus marinus ATCC 50983]|eukprot:XP_002773249.1 cAMP-dependent protein kinase type, putative [Perkinsus marinus ATCC 50983]
MHLELLQLPDELGPYIEIKVSDNKSHPSDRCLLPFFEYQLQKRLAEEVEEIDVGLETESDDEFEDCVDPSVPFCIERFRERAELGKGEFGRCVWVFDVSTGREFALKYLNKSIYRRRGLTAKAAEELRIVSGISHQNIVTFYGAYETADTWAFVFEYCIHGDLAAYMSRNNPVDPTVALGMASRVLQAVNYLHELWIVYRDLKPANVVLDLNYNPKLCDFGLAIWRRSPDVKCRTFCGSAGYCAPEVRAGPEYDDKCDIFSWGALLWALVTGMQAHLHRSWPSTLSGCDPWFEGHLARFPPIDRDGVREVLNMTALANPTERPDSAYLCFGIAHMLRWQTYPCTLK